MFLKGSWKPRLLQETLRVFPFAILPSEMGRGREARGPGVAETPLASSLRPHNPARSAIIIGAAETEMAGPSPYFLASKPLVQEQFSRKSERKKGKEKNSPTLPSARRHASVSETFKREPETKQNQGPRPQSEADMQYSPVRSLRSPRGAVGGAFRSFLQREAPRGGVTSRVRTSDK